MRKQSLPTTKGFTLIELLVVIAIIGVLSSVVLASLNTARAKARDSKRLQDMHQLQLALELYRDANGGYPTSGGNWRGACPTWGTPSDQSGANAWVPSIAPTYIPAVPFDPRPGPAGYECYLYNSNGVDYMLLAYNTAETYTTTSNKWLRPLEPGNATNFAFYTPGAVAW